MRWLIRLGFIAAATLLACSCRGSAPAPHGIGAFHLATVDDADASLKDGLSLGITVGGGREVRALVDTGSLGVAFARKAIGPDAADTGVRGFIEYTSSGRILSGEYFLASIVFRAREGQVSTMRIRVLGVDTAGCAAQYPDCVPQTDVDNVAMLGVGYGEYASTDSPKSSADNPFLQLAAMHDGRMRQAYVLSADRITLGPSPTEMNEFRFVTLSAPTSRGPGLPPIPQAPGCVRFPDAGDREHCGYVLFDSGLSRMIVGLSPTERPATLSTGKSIPDGTRVHIRIGDAVDYTTIIGSAGDPLAPTGTWSRTGPFVNTGRHVLAQYDYLYDADAGRIGFRMRHAPGH